MTEETSGLVKREYSADEIELLYELARYHLENGRLRAADTILEGLVAVAPDCANAWLAKSYVAIVEHDYDAAIFAARQALRIEPNLSAANLFLASCFLRSEDYHAAGTHLGEVAELVESGTLNDRNLHRMYKMLLVKFQNKVSVSNG